MAAPGAWPFRFSGDETIDHLADRLDAAGGWGQIVGPHGSGKSTLLATLLPVCRMRGRVIRQFDLRRGQRRLPWASTDPWEWSARTLVVVDGYEQLRWWRRYQLQRSCRQRKCGLLVTCHRSLGLPWLWEARPDELLFRQLVRDLLAAHPVSQPLSEEVLSSVWQRHQGNFREAFMELYDRVQDPPRRGPATPT